MTINDYIIEIVFNGSTLKNYDPREFSFSIRDSIYSLYSKGSMSFNDASGLILESRVFIDGVPIEISFGYKEEFLKNNFCLHGMENVESSETLKLGGRIESRLIHEFYKSQTRPSKAYRPNPSEIINEIFSGYNFEDTFIEDTKTFLDQKLYQPRMNQKEFIEKILLPNSLSSNSKKSPFYCFIDSRNQLHFESFNGMMNKTPIANLVLNNKNKKENYFEKIISFNPFSFDVTKHKNVLDYSLEYFTDESTPIRKELDRSILDIGRTPYPLFKFEDEIVPFEYNFLSSSIDQADAYILDTQRFAICPEKVLVSTLHYPYFTAGNIIDLEVELFNKEISNSYSGKYLIEQSDQIWDGKSQLGYSQMVLGKMNPEFPYRSEIEGGLKS